MPILNVSYQETIQVNIECEGATPKEISAIMSCWLNLYGNNFDSNLISDFTHYLKKEATLPRLTAEKAANLKFHSNKSLQREGCCEVSKIILVDEFEDNVPFETMPINSESELSRLAEEFDGEVNLSNPTDLASLPVIQAARDLVQQSSDRYTIVVPDNVETLWSGEGCGEWLPAMVYIPNKEIS